MRDDALVLRTATSWVLLMSPIACFRPSPVGSSTGGSQQQSGLQSSRSALSARAAAGQSATTGTQSPRSMATTSSVIGQLRRTDGGNIVALVLRRGLAGHSGRHCQRKLFVGRSLVKLVVLPFLHFFGRVIVLFDWRNQHSAIEWVLWSVRCDIWPKQLRVHSVGNREHWLQRPELDL